MGGVYGKVGGFHGRWEELVGRWEEFMGRWEGSLEDMLKAETEHSPALITQ